MVESIVRVKLEPASDEALISAAAGGAVDAMGELYRRYGPELHQYFRRFESLEAGAEDLVQETFVRVMRYAASFEPHRSFRPWLFGIARNVGLAHRPDRPSERLEAVVLMASGDPESEFATREALGHLNRALRALSADDRRILELAKVEGRGYREIALLFGISEGAVKVRVFRALQRLRAWLHDQGNPGGWLDEH